MPQTKTQQADEVSTLQTSEVATFFNAAVVPNDELPCIFHREAQLQALREEAKRLQEAGWSTAINENTMQVEQWRPRGSFPSKSESHSPKLGNWLKKYLKFSV